MKLFSVFILMLLFISCADSHQLLRTGHDIKKLESDSTVYVAVPKDGRYGKIIYQGSGMNTTQIVLMALSRHVNRVESGYDYQPFDEALESARKIGATYLVVPTILEWEDRATEWSGMPDRVSIRLAIVNARTGESIDSVLIKGKSGLATLGGDHPQDLLPNPVEEYVNSLFE